MAVAERFIFNSDYPLDKIVWFKEGELESSQYGEWDITIPHDLKTTLYVKGVVTSNDWATTYPVGVSIYAGEFTLMSSEVRANDKNVTFWGFMDTASKVKIKYRLWAVMSEEEAKGIDVLTTSDADRNILFFDSEYTYPKLYAEGYLNRGERFYHNLGYIPYVDVWSTDEWTDGYWRQWNDDMFGTIGGYGNIVRNNIERIKLEDVEGGPDKIYYRIYL